MRDSNLFHFYKLIRQRAHYRRLLLGGIVSQLGDWLSYVAISSIAVQEGAGEGAVGVGMAIAGTYLAHSLPNAIASFFVGPIVDRSSRRALILLSYAGACLLTLAIWSQASGGSLLVIQGLLFCRVLMSNLGMTARQAALPSLVTPDELYLANALNSSVWSLLFTLGVALGGILSAFLGPQEAIFIDAMTYLVSFTLITALPQLSPEDRPGQHAVANAPSPDALRSSREVERKGGDAEHQREARGERARRGEQEETPRETREGEHGAQEYPGRLSAAWRFARPRAPMWVPLFAKVPVAFFNSAGWIALNLIAAAKDPAQSGLFIGLFTAARGLGMGVGPALLNARKITSPLPAQWLGLIALWLFVWADNLWLQLPTLFLWGVGNGVNWVSSTATLQAQTPPTLLGRMSSLDFFFFTTCQSIATLGAGLLYDSWGSIPKMLAVVCAVGLAALVSLSLLDLRLRAARTEVDEHR